MHATLELARRVDRAEIDFCALATLVGSPDAATLERGGGLAVYSAPASPVNKMLGLGLGADVSDDDLDAVERFYAERNCPVQIELCPLASSNLAPRLTRRGYLLQAFENELARAAPSEPVESTHGADITVEAGAGERPWLQIVSEGFAAPDRPTPAGSPVPHDAVTAIGEVMRQFCHPEIVRYVAHMDGHAAAGALSFIRDGVLGIFGTATLPAFRRRGLQAAIVSRAMDDARGKADLVIATTEPGSISQRTFERLGFQVVYTRAILVRSWDR
jgi:ribosomal protein S18 acetylase RimI-like enzyme